MQGNSRDERRRRPAGRAAWPWRPASPRPCGGRPRCWSALARGRAAGHARTRPWSGSAWAHWPWPRAGPGCRPWPAWPTRGAGRRAHGARGVRRLALAACGMALAGAARGAGPRRPPAADPRPTRCPGCRSPSGPRGRPTRGARAVVVRPGDTLWALAEHDLPAAGDRPAGDGPLARRLPPQPRRHRPRSRPDPPRPGPEAHEGAAMTRHPDPRPGRLRAGHPGARPEPALRAAGAARADGRPRAVADVVAHRPGPPRPARAVGAPVRPGERRDRRRRPAREPAAAVDHRPGLRRPAPPRGPRGAGPAATSPASAGCSRSGRTW